MPLAFVSADLARREYPPEVRRPDHGNGIYVFALPVGEVAPQIARPEDHRHDEHDGGHDHDVQHQPHRRPLISVHRNLLLPSVVLFIAWRRGGPDGPRNAAAADAPARRGPAIGLTADECTAVLKTCTQRRRTGRGLERPETAARRGLVDGAIVGLLFHGALRRSEVAALRWADVDLHASEDVAVTLRRAQPDGGQGDDVWHLVGACAAAVRRLHAAVAPTPGDRVVGLRVHQINRRFAAACAVAGLEGRRTSHGGRVGLAAELAARGAPMRAIQLAGGWKSPSMVVRYAAAVTTRGGAVRRFLR